MNCWNTLRAHRNHNVAGNGERDGLKIRGIGQSAAKSLGSFKPFDMQPKPLNLIEINSFVVSPSAGRELLKFETGNSLSLLSMKERNDQLKNASCRLIAPDNFVGGFTGLKYSCFNRSIKRIRNKFNSGALAHRNFKDDSVLVSMERAGTSKPIDHNATLSVHKSCKVRNVRCSHNASRLTFNDYPETEYGQAPGRMRQSYLTRADYIVFSAMKVAAVGNHQSDGVWNSEHTRKYKAYLGDDYYALAWPSTLRTFKNNLEMIHQYSDTGFKLIMNGEIGRYENVRLTLH